MHTHKYGTISPFSLSGELQDLRTHFNVSAMCVAFLHATSSRKMFAPVRTARIRWRYTSVFWCKVSVTFNRFNPLKAELNLICYLLGLLGAHHFLHVSRIRVKSLTLRLLMSYIYVAPILDVSRSHTTTHHRR